MFCFLLFFQVPYSVVNLVPDFPIGLIAAFLAVTAPAKALKVIYVITGPATLYRANMVCFEQEIVTKARAQVV
jgi:hypothetical protein